MVKKNCKDTPKASGGDAVCELDNLWRYQAGCDLISSQRLPRSSTPTAADSSSTKGMATLKRLGNRIGNVVSGSFLRKRPASSHQVGSAFTRVLVRSELFACNDAQPANCSRP